MSDKLKISQAVIVEGRYDKIKLSEFIDAFIVETNGFGVFKDKERLSFIKKLANERGIVILTDSDHAGFMIRGYISSGVPKDKIYHVYIPDVYGKEKRKREASKEGKLGVEGMSRKVLLEAFEKANIDVSHSENADPVTNYDLYEAGISGVSDAKQKRKALLKALDLPEFLSANSLLSCINNTMTRDEFFEIIKSL